ncbi:hypothetical protein CH373_14330 [Leptospira perolatii]|uniref:HTH araC/xylS-type domain-containing protein n=1 Tax=Leptospira perolatii TaxID=2023191 RepID=A0A2M9ZJU8_9LEPT|nr:AraC family transcriptional regulator [Leptospira perolatii]PJZ69283.1 hypothetical protein CH360_12290 [Leptospira perolatii]PJZ72335.1 hypothetical protein CH373_14330 [Leptospira perolatii]
MFIVPQHLSNTPNVECLAANLNSGIYYKDLEKPVIRSEVFVSSLSLSVVLKGDKRISSFEGEEIPIDEGEIVLMPKDLYMVTDLLPVQNRFESFIFFFSQDIVDEFLASKSVRLLTNSDREMLFHLPYSQSIDLFLTNLRSLFKGVKRGKKDLLRWKLLELLQLVTIEDKSETFISYLLSNSVKKERDLQEFMNKNYDKPLSVEDYADLTGRSLSTFQREFKKMFHCPPGQWLLDKRMEKARSILEKGNTTVTDVAFEIGYENISHFIKAYKQKYNISPKQFLLQRKMSV